MDEFVQVVLAGVLGICAIGATAYGINRTDDLAVAAMVQSGADPVAAACAVNRGAREVCAILAARKP